MAASKEKLLESAQKSLKKKQLTKAIKDYVKVVDLDPGDVRSRQKLAELYVRTNKNAEAYEHYESVAKYFASNGFYLKAIAIYKQMQRLDPKQVALFNRLAELNEKQGLVGNAMAEYRNLVNYYERNDMVADAIKTLEKMRDLDGSNLNVRVKLAEVYATNQREDEGLGEFESVMKALKDRREYDKVLKLYKMFLPLYPHNQQLQLGLAQTLYDKGAFAKGLEVLSGLLKDKPEDPDVLRLIARGHSDLKDWDNAHQTYQQLLSLDPSDLETRNTLITCHFEHQKYDEALAELEEWKDEFFKAERVEHLRGYYESLKEHLPGNKVVRQTLDSIYELTGDGGKLLDIISEVETPEDEPVLAEETLSDSLLDSAAEDIETSLLDIPEGEDAEEFVLDTPVEESDFELDLEPSSDLDELSGGVDTEEIIELDISNSEALDTLEGDDLEFSFDLDSEDTATEPQAQQPQRDLRADLEEAEFYIQQGLYVEAEKLCSDILDYAPDSVDCQQKIEEIRAHLAEGQETASAELHDLASEVLTDGFPDLDEDSASDSFTQFDSEQKIFRTDVDEQIAADDLESHYNLGIAYREMGLLDDAISEFSKAERDPSRYVDCQTLKGLCFCDKGDHAQSEVMFQQALDSPHLEDPQRINLCYELGSLYERSDRFEEALSSYQLVVAQDQEYRDASEKVAQLRSRLGASTDELPPADEGKERISFL